MEHAFESLRAELHSRRRILLQKVEQVEDDLRSLDTNVESEVNEEGQEESIARLLSRLDDHDRAEIEAIDAALQRMELGDYGLCTECGEPIPLARLQALPTAESCIACAEARERGPG